MTDDKHKKIQKNKDDKQSLFSNTTTFSLFDDNLFKNVKFDLKNSKNFQEIQEDT